MSQDKENRKKYGRNDSDKIYFPRQFDLGWIFYNDENNSLLANENEHYYWEVIRQLGVKDANEEYESFIQEFSGQKLQAKMLEYADAINNMALAERERENRIMSAFGDNKVDYSNLKDIEFLKYFNEIIIGEERFLGIINRLDIAINKGGKERAPSQSVNFANDFIARFNDEIEKLKGDDLEELLDPDSPKWEQMLRSAADNAVNHILNEFDETKNPMFGFHSDYEELDKFLKGNKHFYSFLNSYFKIDEIKKFVADKIKLKRHKPGKKGIKINQVFTKTTKIDGKEYSGGELFYRMIGGFVEEYLGQGRIEVNLSKKTKNIKGSPVKSNIGGTDTVTVVSFKKEVNVGKIEEDLQKAMDGESQKDIAKEIKHLNEKLSRKKYSDVFVLHTSNKLYSMGDSFRSFNKKQNIYDLKQLLNESGIGNQRFGNLVISLYSNTAKGAVFSGDNGGDEKRQRLIESLRVIVAAVAGKFLFSDWTMIGLESTGAQQIHVFDLDGVLIPLSFILEGLSKALADFGNKGAYSGILSVGNFTSPAILYPKSKGANRYTGLGDPTQNFNEYWLEQRKDVRTKAHFTIRLVKNFKTIIQDIVKSIK